MPTPNDILDRARSQLGYTEGRCGPSTLNKTKFGEWYGMNCVAWCAMFVSWVFHSEGLPLPASTSKGFAYTPSGAAWFRRRQRWGTTPMVGAVVFYDFIGRISHVGIVERVHPDGSFDAIEGNTNGAGSREGGQAMRKRRTMAKVVGFGYPDYSSKEGDWLDMATKKEVSDLIDNRLREYFGKIIGSGQDSFEHTIEAILRVTQRTFNEANAANAKADGIERISTRLEAQNKLLQRGQTIVVDEASAKLIAQAVAKELKQQQAPPG